MPPTVSLATPEAALRITRDNFSWGELGKATGPISYGFRDTAPPEAYGSGEGKSFSKVNDEQRKATIEALKEWASIANITFEAVNPDGFTDKATILIANWEDPTPNVAAHAYFPEKKNKSFESQEGDFWFNVKTNQYDDIPLGSYEYTTVLHELGHSLGLAHPGNYNAGENQEATYEKDAEYIEDSLQYSVMSYFPAAKTYANHVVGTTTIGPSTPLLDDIAAIQRLYGANMNTRVGDTIYGFNSTAGDPAFLLAEDKQAVFTIWDAGGSNTLDLSGYSTAQRLDLRQGEFSNAGSLTKNISIALGTVIQKGIGGSGSDTLIGNDSDNVLTGNDGNDGIDGGLGHNTSAYAGPAKNYALEFTAKVQTFTITDRVGTDGIDALTNIQELSFAGQTMSMADFLVARDLPWDSIAKVIELYIVEENRAPDALGLAYWAGRLAAGMTLRQIADSFFAQPETASIYSPSLNNHDFVTAAYQNVFGRTPDTDGLNYWADTLSGGAISRGWFLYSFLYGASQASLDNKTVDNKVTVSSNFAMTKGLSNSEWGHTVLSGVNGTAESVTAANAQTATFAAMAADPATSELVVKLIGIA